MRAEVTKRSSGEVFTVHKEELATGATRDGAAPRQKEPRLHTSHIRIDNKNYSMLTRVVRCLISQLSAAEDVCVASGAS